ncbi:UPF0696 protein C11orf68 homolog [Lampetra planeri]
MMEVEELGTEQKFQAEEYAAEAMAADMDPWETFNSLKRPLGTLDAWLDTNRPSVVNRHGDASKGLEPVGWICVQGPSCFPSSEDMDVCGLQEAWEQLTSCSEHITFGMVRRLALDHCCLVGKWLIHMESGFKVDHAWRGLAKAVAEGLIPMAKVSPHDPSGKESKHVICVYSCDFTREDDVYALDTAIRATGVKARMTYKPDVYTYLGIYRNNRWGLCPTIYDSKFDLESTPRRSRITCKFSDE